jgi:thiol-disulfide isomerase/thioredoxin
MRPPLPAPGSFYGDMRLASHWLSLNKTIHHHHQPQPRPPLRLFPSMKTLIRLFLFLAAILPALHAAEAAVDPAADAAWEAYQAVSKARPKVGPDQKPTVELYQQFEERALKLRELGLAFLEKFPHDPRRWQIVLRFTPISPSFVKEWGSLNSDGQPERPVIDTEQAAAWKAQVAALHAEMEKAADLPPEVKEIVTTRVAERERTQAFRARWQSGRNEPAPDFTMQSFDGGEMKLSDYRGKVVVLDFWASWCGPCQESMPHNQEIAVRYKDQDVVILAVCVWDKREKADAWLKENRASYADLQWAFEPTGRGEGNPAKALYDVSGIPCQFVIDREGRVVDAVIGFSKDRSRLEGALVKAGVKVDPAVLAGKSAAKS